MRGFDYEFSLLSLPHKLFLPKHPISLMTSYLQQLNVFLQLLLEIPESSSRPEQLSFLEVPGVLDLCSLFTHSLFSNSVSFFSFFLFLFLLTVLRHCYLAIYCKSGKEEIFCMFPVGLCINNRQPGGSCPWVVGAQMATIRPSLDSHRPACSLTSLPLGAWALSRVLLWLPGNPQRLRSTCVVGPVLSSHFQNLCLPPCEEASGEGRHGAWLFCHPGQRSAINQMWKSSHDISGLFMTVKSLSCVRLFVTPWTVAHQAPLSMGFSREEYRSGLPFSSPGDLPDPGIEPRPPELQADALPFEPPGTPIILERL